VSVLLADGYVKPRMTSDIFDRDSEFPWKGRIDGANTFPHKVPTGI